MALENSWCCSGSIINIWKVTGFFPYGFIGGWWQKKVGKIQGEEEEKRKRGLGNFLRSTVSYGWG